MPDDSKATKDTLKQKIMAAQPSAFGYSNDAKIGYELGVDHALSVIREIPDDMAQRALDAIDEWGFRAPNGTIIWDLKLIRKALKAALNG